MRPVESLSGIYAGAIARLEGFAASRHWRWKLVGGLALALTLLSFNPRFVDRITSRPDVYPQVKWEVLEQQSKTLLMQPAAGHPESNEAKQTFRLTVPLVMKILHLNRDGVLVLQVLSTILFLYFSVRLVERTTGDPVLAILTTAALGLTYTGSAGLTDAFAWGDEFAYLFILLAMCSSNVFAIVLFVLLAAWTDERGFIACLLAFAWWKFRELHSAGLNARSLFTFGARSTAVMTGMLLYLAGRWLIGALTGLHTPLEETGIEVLRASTNYVALAMWGALEGLWLPVLIALLCLASHTRNAAALMLLGMMSAILLVALSVHDITRSAAYLFPLTFISLLVLSEHVSTRELRILFAMAVVVCFLSPSYCVVTTWNPSVAWSAPLFIKAIGTVGTHLFAR